MVAPGPRVTKAMPGPPGHLAVGVGHIGDPAFLPAHDDVDVAGVVKRVEHGEEAFAGDGEDPVAPLDSKLVDEDLAAGSDHWLGHRAPLAAPSVKGEG